jgi:hypothetical protein
LREPIDLQRNAARSWAAAVRAAWHRALRSVPIAAHLPGAWAVLAALAGALWTLAALGRHHADPPRLAAWARWLRRVAIAVVVAAFAFMNAFLVHATVVFYQ